MKINNDQRGTGHIIFILAVVVLVVIGLAGYKVSQSSTSTSQPASGALHSATVPKNITSKADIKRADQALSQTSIDSGVNPSSLDSDLQALL